MNNKNRYIIIILCFFQFEMAQSTEHQQLNHSGTNWFSKMMEQTMMQYTNKKSKLQVLAEQGDVESQVALAFKYYYGKDGTKQDFAKAETWFRKAAIQENPIAQYKLGSIYQSNNKRVSPEELEALRLKAKAQGHTLKYTTPRYSNTYFDRQGNKRKCSEAFYWYYKAAINGLVKAKYQVGLLYLSASGVKNNRDLGKEWIREAAQQGSSKAQSLLKVIDK